MLLSLTAIVLPYGVCAADTGAAEDTGAAIAPIAALNGGLLAAMKAGHSVPFATRYAQLAPIIEQAFDLTGILRGSVGRMWAMFTPADQASLLDAFRRYTVSSYLSNFSKFSGERFDILPDRRTVGDETIISTQITPLTGTPARIDYVLHPVAAQTGSSWKIVDILLDGSISQVAVQRSEFHGAVSGGAAPLIAVLDRKSASLSAGP